MKIQRNEENVDEFIEKGEVVGIIKGGLGEEEEMELSVVGDELRCLAKQHYIAEFCILHYISLHSITVKLKLLILD